MSAAESGNTWDDKSSMSKESEDLSQKMPACNNSRLQLRTGTLQEEGNFCLSKKIILTTEHSAFIKEGGKTLGMVQNLAKIQLLQSRREYKICLQAMICMVTFLGGVRPENG